MSRKAFFVVNPHSANGSTASLWSQTKPAIKSRFSDVDFALTRGSMDAALITAKALERGFDLLVAVGGDGTLNEVLNGFFSDGVRTNPEAVLGYLPNGTGGDFARTLGFHSLKWPLLIEHLADSPPQMVDCGEATYVSEGGQTQSRLFLNESSVGFSADTGNAVNMASKRFGGKLSFFIGVIRCLAGLKNPVLTVKIDGQKLHDGPTLLISVANGKYFGGSMMIAPHAEIDDGFFDVVIISAMNRRSVIRKIGNIYKGTHLTLPEVTIARGEKIEISATERVLLELDGEQPGHLEAEFSVSKKTIPFVCGPIAKGPGPISLRAT